VTHQSKVLHIITRLISGGADENTVYTCEGLDVEKFRVDLVVGGQSELHNFPQIKNSNVIQLSSLVREIHPLNDVKTLFSLVRMIRRERYEIVHTHTAKAGILGRTAAKLAGAPIIIHTLHGSTFHDAINKVNSFIYKFLEKITAKWTDVIISVGDDLKERYIRAGVGTPRQYVTIRSGFELSEFLLDKAQISSCKKALHDELGVNENEIIIGSASRLEARKGHIYLLEAARSIIRKNENVHFVIAGDGGMDDELKHWVKSQNLQERIHFLGFRRDIEKVIAGFDIFTLTSLWEGLPRVLVQAAALQKPIVTFNVEGATEMVNHGENGFVVQKKDTQRLIDYLTLLVNEPRRVQIMGEKSLAKVTAAWDKENMVARISELYAELLAGDKG